MIALGYRPDLERHDLLEKYSAPFPSLSGLYTAREIEFRPWRPNAIVKWMVTNQGPVGRCRGESLAASARQSLLIQLRTELDLDKDGRPNEVRDDHFSAQWCYVRCRHYDGIRGDNGSTIYGGIKVGMQDGIARDCVYPTDPRRDNTRVPNGAAEDARQFKFKRYTKITNEQQAFDWVQSGQGAIDWGTVWPLPFRAGCVVTSLPARAGGGGHATCGIGMIYGKTLREDVPSAPVDKDELVYVFANSHSTQAQHSGFYYVTREGFASVLKHRHTAVIGWSDLEAPIVREWDADVFDRF